MNGTREGPRQTTQTGQPATKNNAINNEKGCNKWQHRNVGGVRYAWYVLCIQARPCKSVSSLEDTWWCATASVETHTLVVLLPLRRRVRARGGREGKNTRWSSHESRNKKARKGRPNVKKPGALVGGNQSRHEDTRTEESVSK